MTFFTLNRDSSGATNEATTVSDTSIDIHLLSGQTAYFDVPEDSSKYKIDLKYISNVQSVPDGNSVLVEANSYPIQDGIIKKESPSSIVVPGGSRIFFTPVREGIDTDIYIIVNLYKLDGGSSLKNPATEDPTWIQILPASYTTLLSSTPITNAFTASGYFPDSAYSDVTSLCTWTTDHPEIATVELIGNTVTLTTLTVGNTMVRAHYGAGISSVAQVVITLAPAPSLVSISIQPSTSQTVRKGNTLQFYAIGTYSDGSTSGITEHVTWTSSNTAAATISLGGLLSSLTVASTNITATLAGVTSPITAVTVGSAIMVEAYFLPSAITSSVGDAVPVTPYGRYSDGSVLQVAAQYYTTSSSAVTILGFNVTAASVGLAELTFTAYLDMYAGTYITSKPTAISVISAAAPTLVSIALNPITEPIYAGQVQQMYAFGTYSDSSTKNLTSLVSWTSSNPVIATVSTNNNNVTAVGVGSAYITATLNGITSAHNTITVSAAAVIRAYLLPTATTAVIGAGVSLTAYGVFTDGTTSAITALTWASSSSSVTVSGSTLTAAALGIAEITFTAYASVSQGTYITSEPAGITVIAASGGSNIPAPEYDNYIINGQFSVLNNYLIPNTVYNVSAYTYALPWFYITGSASDKTVRFGEIAYYRQTDANTYIDTIKFLPTSVISGNVDNASHMCVLSLNNNGLTSGAAARVIEVNLGDVLTLSGKNVVCSFLASTDNFATVTIDAVQRYNGTTVVTTLGSSTLGAVSTTKYISGTIPTVTGYSIDESVSYCSIRFKIFNTSPTGNTSGVTITNLQVNQTTSHFPYNYKTLSNLTSYSNALMLPQTQSVKTLFANSTFGDPLEQNGYMLTMNRDASNYGQSYLSYTAPVAPMTLALTPKFSGYTDPVAPSGWILATGTYSTAPIFSSTKYRRLYKTMVAAELDAAFTPDDSVSAVIYSSGVARVISFQAGSAVTVTFYVLPTFSRTISGTYTNITCGSAADIIASGYQGYIKYTTSQLATWYWVFVVDGIIRYPTAVTEREKIVYISINSTDLAPAVAIAMVSACNDMSFCVPASIWNLSGSYALMMKT
jgi:uncharacterized protein YjdB